MSLDSYRPYALFALNIISNPGVDQQPLAHQPHASSIKQVSPPEKRWLCDYIHKIDCVIFM